MQNRLIEIDLLRGFAVIGMIFSGILPFNGGLPAWMYHAQVPPPNHFFDPTIPGLTWVDLVFPFFLFSMGAVIPSVFPANLEKNGIKSTFFQLFKRFVLLLALAIISFNFAPLRNLGAGNMADLVGIGIYTALFLVLCLFPRMISSRAFSLKISGVFLLLGLLYMKNVYWGGLNIQNNDSILRVLANVYFVGAILWFASKDNETLRIGFIFLILSAYLGDIEMGYMQDFWRWQDPWHLISPYLLKYLILFLLGTIAGDWLMKREFIFQKPAFQWDYFILSMVVTICILSGLFQRNIAFTLLSGILALSFFYYRQKLKKELGSGKSKLFYAGIFILFCGLLMEPFQGGVKKDPSTLSYFFIAGGLAFIWVFSFGNMNTSKLDLYFSPIKSLGKNALMAYFIAGFLIIPFFNLSGMSDIFGQATLFLVIKAVLVTFLSGAIVHYLTKKGFFWKI